MINSFSLIYDTVMNFKYRSDGHYHLYVPTFYNTSNYANDKIDFIFDTGAYITIITRQTALLFEMDKIKPIKEGIEIKGFVGSCKGDLKEIPGFIIGGKKFEGVKVVIPHLHTKNNILGLNVLEHFNYYIDNTESDIYFSENKNYKAPNEFQCFKILPIST